MTKFFLLLALSFSTFSFAEDFDISKYIEVRRDSSDLNNKGKPAEIFYQDYKQKEGEKDIDSSYRIDIAISGKFEFNEDGSTLVKGTFEQHKNTFSDDKTEKQDTYLYKASYHHKVEVSKYESGKDDFVVRPNYSFTVKNNEITNARSWVLSAETNFYRKKWNIDSYGINPNKQFPFYWAPTFGVEYSDIVHTENGEEEGDFSRVKVGLEVSSQILAETFNDKLTLSLEYDFWDELSKSKELGEKQSYKQAIATLSYAFTGPEKNAEGKYVDPKVLPVISLKYFNGENPATDTPDQEYVGLSFGLKI